MQRTSTFIVQPLHYKKHIFGAFDLQMRQQVKSAGGLL